MKRSRCRARIQTFYKIEEPLGLLTRAAAPSLVTAAATRREAARFPLSPAGTVKTSTGCETHIEVEGTAVPASQAA